MDLPLYGMRKFIASLEGKYAGRVPRQLVCRYFPLCCGQNKKACKSLNLQALHKLLLYILAERTGFEPVVPVTQYVSLANWWFQPLTHLSGPCQLIVVESPPTGLQS